MHPPQRRIAHLDMDAFYASVERLRRPELAGLPLVIGGRAAPGERLRLLGVRVSGLTRAPQPAPRQLELDWPPSGEAA
ncbi:impB/mucB/samB family protein [Ectothiorhodospira mobilis]|uniref:ImpB/mucB/samB family protein n=1 Tax=Ectothiorhodospira mobilis TaxID=195064 RepID=A0A1I4Q3X6_ECTMO|nr:impB/mucB/samB family protein [Ectothiorhodospira mobilis]